MRRGPLVAAVRGKHFGFTTYRISTKQLNELRFQSALFPFRNPHSAARNCYIPII